MGNKNNFWTPQEYEILKKHFIKHLTKGELVGKIIENYAKNKKLSIHQVRCAWYRVKNKERIEINLIDNKVQTTDNKNEISTLVETQVITDEEYIKQITDYYRKYVTNYIQPQDEKGLQELYYWLRSRNVDVLKYMTAAIDIFARKDSDTKKSFGYLVNMLRNWTTYGFGYMPAKEDSLLTDIFEKALNIKLSVAARNRLIPLISTYGLVELSFVLGKELTNIQEVDMSLIYVKKFEYILEKISSS